MFTLPYALAGRDAVYLWMTTAFAISLSGLVFAWRVAYWLVGTRPERRWAGHVAGLAAALAVLGIYDFPHSILSAESDTMIVALCLAAADCDPLPALPLGVLGRCGWRRSGGPKRGRCCSSTARGRSCASPGCAGRSWSACCSCPLLWFGIPALTSKSPFSRRQPWPRTPRALHGDKITGTIARFLALEAAAVKIAALVAVTPRRRCAGTAGSCHLAAAVVLWVAVEIAFALHGWSAVPRYIYEAGAGDGGARRRVGRPGAHRSCRLARARCACACPRRSRSVWPGSRSSSRSRLRWSPSPARG